MFIAPPVKMVELRKNGKIVGIVFEDRKIPDKLFNLLINFLQSCKTFEIKETQKYYNEKSCGIKDMCPFSVVSPLMNIFCISWCFDYFNLHE